MENVCRGLQLNPSDAQLNIQIALNGAKFASSGHLYRMASDSIDATVAVDKKLEAQVQDQMPGLLPDMVTVRPFTVNIYSYAVE